MILSATRRHLLSFVSIDDEAGFQEEEDSHAPLLSTADEPTPPELRYGPEAGALMSGEQWLGLSIHAYVKFRRKRRLRRKERFAL